MNWSSKRTNGVTLQFQTTFLLAIFLTTVSLDGIAAAQEQPGTPSRPANSVRNRLENFSSKVKETISNIGRKPATSPEPAQERDMQVQGNQSYGTSGYSTPGHGNSGRANSGYGTPRHGTQYMNAQRHQRAPERLPTSGVFQAGYQEPGIQAPVNGYPSENNYVQRPVPPAPDRFTNETYPQGNASYPQSSMDARDHRPQMRQPVFEQPAEQWQGGNNVPNAATAGVQVGHFAHNQGISARSQVTASERVLMLQEENEQIKRSRDAFAAENERLRGIVNQAYDLQEKTDSELSDARMFATGAQKEIDALRQQIAHLENQKLIHEQETARVLDSIRAKLDDALLREMVDNQ